MTAANDDAPVTDDDAGHIAAARELLKDSPEAIAWIRDVSGRITPLLRAEYKANAPVVAELLAMGACFRAANVKHGNQDAADSGTATIMEKLRPLRPRTRRRIENALRVKAW